MPRTRCHRPRKAAVWRSPTAANNGLFARISVPSLAGAVGLAFCLFPVAPAAAQVHNWVNPGAGQTWTDPTSWIPFGLPGPGDIARIGNLPVAQNSSVRLPLLQPQMIGGLELTNNTRLALSASLEVNSDIVIDGAGQRSELVVQSGGAILEARNITVNDGDLVIQNGREAIARGVVTIGSNAQLEGRGVLEFLGNTGVVFVNNGVINTDSGFGGLVLNQGGDGLIDLDGGFGNGSIVIDQGNSFFGQDRFTVNGIQLADSFSGSIHLTTASILDMNLSAGWTADANSQITVQSTTTNSDGLATITGGPLTLGGTLNLLSDAEGNGDEVLLQSDTTFQNTAVVNVESNNELLIQGATSVLGGTFNTPSNLGSAGRVVFGGELTQWAGTIDINGFASQTGDARVIAPTVINAGVIDLDGSGDSTWVIDSSLTINADGVDSSISNTFDGAIAIGGTPESRLTVNLTDPLDHWTVAGALILMNDGPQNTQIAGSARLRLTGDLSVFGTGNRVEADFDFAASSRAIDQGGPGRLTVAGRTRVEAGAALGLNRLTNDTAGELILFDGASLGVTDLVNQGLLQIGDPDAAVTTGIALADRFESTDQAEWRVGLGGHVPGNDFDRLLVTGEALINGTLTADLLTDDTGELLFTPQFGDTFLILTSLGGVSGEFDLVPSTVADGNLYGWEVLYQPHDVVLRLDSITTVPEPASLALLVLGVAGTACRRRTRPTF